MVLRGKVFHINYWAALTDLILGPVWRILRSNPKPTAYPMKIDVFDTHVTTSDGRRLHFDVMLLAGKGDLASQYAKEWLGSIGIDTGHIHQESCRYCHSETARPDIQRYIETQGYFIYQMEGCPAALP
jgi:hypothetical protein